ncbi:hypothetical protein [Adhaeribacter radiodurans]|uniref:DUF304 domain-containing protein n=1 Tax=Adhaeribacter radiodurans TaxID=2745197 RepID=A0A7L7LDQ6_9BACT|nr:hypothetical protein [Adhaeribacter radiodurans]QMU30913.1 hypothetical protein HUW48_24080 [Adhaeribacter radiodurans]
MGITQFLVSNAALALRIPPIAKLRHVSSKWMKAKSDKTIPYIIIGYGLVFIIPALLSPSLGLTSPAGIIWCSLGIILFVLPGLWKIETYELVNTNLFKSNFWGLYKRTVDLTDLMHYKVKLVNMDFASNPLNVVRFFSKDIKYLKYRKLTLKFEHGSKITIDERTIDKADYNKLLNKIRGIKSTRKK